MPNVVIFDIETVPDYSAWPGHQVAAEPVDPEAEPAPKRRGRPSTKTKKEPFPPHYAHQIVTFGFLLIQDGVPAVLNAATATNVAEEKTLLAGVNNFLSTCGASVVTWNGRGFDWPVIQLRSLRHGIGQAWYGSDFRRRYDTAHIDLCDVLTEYGALGKTGYSLDVFSQLIGLPGKGDVDGSNVAEMYAGGKHTDIANYCKRDVVQTACLYLRWQLMRGQINLSEYRASIATLQGMWELDAGFNGFNVNADLLGLV